MESYSLCSCFLLPLPKVLSLFSRFPSQLLLTMKPGPDDSTTTFDPDKEPAPFPILPQYTFPFLPLAPSASLSPSLATGCLKQLSLAPILSPPAALSLTLPWESLYLLLPGLTQLWVSLSQKSLGWTPWSGYMSSLTKQTLSNRKEWALTELFLPS